MKIFRKYFIVAIIAFTYTTIIIAQNNNFYPMSNKSDYANWCGTPSYKPLVKSNTTPPYYPCYASSRDSFIPDNSTPVKYFTLLIIVVDSDIYAVNQENIDSMMVDVNKYFDPWKIQFCYSTVFIDSSELYLYPQNKDSVINVVIQDWPTLGQSGNPIKLDYSVVINNNYLGGNVLAHELGHDFQLAHTFSTLDLPPSNPYVGCSYPYRDRVDYPLSVQDTIGDGCSDTPPTPKNNSCAPPQGVDSCSIGNPPWPAFGYENLMGYTWCANAVFTPQQAGRMHCYLEQHPILSIDSTYKGWLAYGNLHCNPNPNTANNDLAKAEKLKLDVFPNPFSNITNISVSLPFDDNALIEIYNYIGQQVAKVFEQEAIKNYEYKINFDGINLNNGIYFVVIRTSTETKIKKAVVLR